MEQLLKKKLIDNETGEKRRKRNQPIRTSTSKDVGWMMNPIRLTLAAYLKENFFGFIYSWR